MYADDIIEQNNNIYSISGFNAVYCYEKISVIHLI